MREYSVHYHRISGRSMQRLLFFFILLLNLVLITPQNDCIRFGNTFDVSLVGDTVDLPCQVPGNL